MTTKVVPGQLIATLDAEHVAREASARIAKALRDAIAVRGTASIALSGGNTPRDAYTRLAKEAGLDWNKVALFWVDERAVPPTDGRSNYRMVKETLLDHVAIPPAQVHRMPADAADLEEAAKEYDGVVRSKVRMSSGAPALDILVLGIGEDGHTASLFPGEATVEITDRYCAPVPAATGREARLTLTAPVIENAWVAFVLAVGKNKSQALERVWSTSGRLRDTPARVVRGIRGGLTWVIDKAAGGMG
jgi:6-phosphogluconolactonase